MKKIIILMMLVGLAGCGSITKIKVHKDDLHALIEIDNKKCIIQFNRNRKDNEYKIKDINADFACDEVKYFNEGDN